MTRQTHHLPQVLGCHGNIEVDVTRHLLSMRTHWSCYIMTTTQTQRLMGNAVYEDELVREVKKHRDFWQQSTAVSGCQLGEVPHLLRKREVIP